MRRFDHVSAIFRSKVILGAFALVGLTACGSPEPSADGNPSANAVIMDEVSITINRIDGVYSYVFVQDVDRDGINETYNVMQAINARPQQDVKVRFTIANHAGGGAGRSGPVWANDPRNEAGLAWIVFSDDDDAWGGEAGIGTQGGQNTFRRLHINGDPELAGDGSRRTHYFDLRFAWLDGGSVIDDFIYDPQVEEDGYGDGGQGGDGN